MVSVMTVLLNVRRHPQRFDVARWREHGFESEADSRLWSDRACGIACVAMLLEHFTGTPAKVHDLLHEGRELGAYSPRGWIHAGLARLVRRQGIGAEATQIDPEHTSDLLGEALAEGPVIASVTLALPTDGSRGGHLILLTGLTRAPGEVVVHFRDPSTWGEQNTWVDWDRFAASFTGRVVRTWRPSSGQPEILLT